eukprot:9287815-Alexandrium_andersonii.AAC.1
MCIRDSWRPAGAAGGSGAARRAASTSSSLGRRDHDVRLRALVHAREVRPTPWQVHGVLHDVPWRRRAQG